MAPQPRERSNHSSIAVIGAGALGSEVCRQLAENNFTNVLVIDPDQLEERNIHFSLIYQAAVSMKGRKVFDEFKVNLLANVIAHRYGLSWSTFAEEIADVGLGFLHNIELILSCTDSALARVETTRVAHVLGVPMIDGGVMVEGTPAGRAVWFSPDCKAACYLCGISERRRAEIFTYAASASLGCHVSEEIAAMTASSRTVHETATAMVSLIQRWQRDTISTEHSFALRLDSDLLAEQWSQLLLNLPQSATCPWHEDESGKWCSIREDRPIREAFMADNLCIQLLWPQCLTARCRFCNAHSEPFRRVAWVRRKGLCVNCGTRGNCEPIEVIDTLSPTTAQVDLMPWQLGLPKQHLYLFRRNFVPVTR